MIGAPVPGVVNALQVTIPGRSPSVPSVKALGNARDEKKRSARSAAASAPASSAVLMPKGHFLTEKAKILKKCINKKDL